MKRIYVTFLFFLAITVILVTELLSLPKTSEKPRKLNRAEIIRVEGYMNYFSDILYRYYCMNGEYPISFDQLLNSGLIVVWPINPLKGEPVKIHRNIREYDFKSACDICYVNKSANEGYFVGIFQVGRSDEWRFITFPEVIDREKYLELKKRKPESYSEAPNIRFAKSIVSLFGTLKDINLEGKNRLPWTCEELFGDDFRIIKESYKPVYKGDNPDEDGFYELGVDLDLGYWYSKYRIMPGYTHRFALKFPYEGLKLNEREFINEKFPKMISPLILLSPSKQPDWESFPPEILISIDDIQYVRE